MNTCGKEPACQHRRCKRHRFNPWLGKIPNRRTKQPAQVFLAGKSHGHRHLVGYSPQGLKELGTEEATQHSTYIHTFIKLAHLKEKKIKGKNMAIISVQLIVMHLPNPLYYQDYISKCEVVYLDTLCPLISLFGIILKDYEMLKECITC